LGIGMTLAWFLRYGATWSRQPRSVVQTFALTLLASWLIWSILSTSLDLDGSRGGWRVPAIVSHLLLSVAIVMIALLAAGYLSRFYVSRLALAYFSLITFVGFVSIRILAKAILNTRYRVGAVRRVVIVGSGPVAREAAERFEQHPEMLCKVVGFLSPEDACLEVLNSQISPGTEIVSICGVVELLKRRRVEELVFAASRNGTPGVAELMDQCVKQGIAVSIIPQPYELYLSAPELMDLDGIPILRLRHSLWEAEEPSWKRVMDLVLTIPLLLLSLPVILISAFLLKITKGSAFRREERYGLRGRQFWLYRLDSPRNAFEAPFYELIIQHLSITELPQLLNVLQGDMSLVGPRPEGFESVRHYTDWHRQRLSVRPGMTGLAQVHGMREQSSLEQKTRYDLQYILRRSLFQDVALLLQTMWTLTRRLGHLSALRGAESIRPSPESKSLVA